MLCGKPEHCMSAGAHKRNGVMIQLVAAFSAKVEVLQFTPAGLSLPVPAQKPTVPPTHAMFGLDFSQVIPDTENAC
jgi:hypothetical protein